MLPLLATIGLLCMGSAIAAPAAAVATPTVSLASGVVIGKVTTATSGVSTTSTVYNYLGVPFAAVPTGTLRFRPPAAASAWNTPVQATGLPPACLQQFTSNENKVTFDNPGHAPPAESEDCLYLNIFAPTSASSSNKKPVLFWIFGGDLDFGTASLNYYNGSSFAAFQDVVVVAINYRTNIFGFPNSPELASGQQNVGYLDQRAGLQWVQSNIAQFGGDPTKVTIFGESAGGYSVKQLLANPPNPLPFSAAIMESQGASTGVGTGFEVVAAAFGCALASSQLACMQKVDAHSIEQYISNNSVTFYPVNDGMTQVSDVRPNILNKQFANVPILIGTNSKEGSIFAALWGLDTANASIAQVQQVLQTVLPNNPQLQQQALNAYSAVSSTPFDILSAILTDLLFTCTTSSLSTFLSANGYNKVWRYYYNATISNLLPYPDLGAFHFSEIPEVWGTYDLQNSIGKATQNQIVLSGFIQKIWADFAKVPTQGPGWPRLTGNDLTDRLGELGGRNATGETTIGTIVTDYQCPLFDAVIAAEGY